MSHASLDTLLAREPQTAKALIQALHISQPTLSRLLKNQTNRIVKIGKARATRYALKRPIRNLGQQWPVYRVTGQAHVHLAGQLIAIYPHYFVWRDALTGQDNVYESLPWFLWDVRPQGFMGRIFNQEHQDLALPARLEDWNDDDVMAAILRDSSVLASHWLIGEQSRLDFDEERQFVLRLVNGDRETMRSVYPFHVDRTIKQEAPASSAAGMQPKFSLLIKERQQIVELLIKFSPPINTPNGQRWSDLLRAEHLALQTLSYAGIATASSEIVQISGRTFLEVIRFDRAACLGRRGMVSLEAVSNEFVGHKKDWDEQAQSLLALGKISEQDYQAILYIYAFGRLIANEDMHNGNLSFFLADDFSLTLAPVYDMLPMRFAPTVHGEVVTRAVKIAQPTPLTQSIWPVVSKWAKAYWQLISEDARISESFRALAREYRDAL